MFSLISQAFISFFDFFIHPKMSTDAEDLLFETTTSTTKLFLFIIASWAHRSKVPQLITDRFRVRCIIHTKNSYPPEQEYLVIETEDTTNGKIHLQGLERYASHTTTSPPPEQSDKAAKLFATFRNLLKTGSSHSSIEEGLGSTSTGLTSYDQILVSTTQAADLVMDSLKKSGGYRLAVDQFVGGGRILEKEYHGRIVQYFKPKNLSLFELAVLAHVVHEANPIYDVLDTQCYYYAALVYAVAAKYSEVLTDESADDSRTDLVEIKGSYFSNRYGRWKGMKVTHVDPDSSVVHAILARFKEERDAQLAEVFVTIFQIFLFLSTFSQISEPSQNQQKLQAIQDVIKKVNSYCWHSFKFLLMSLARVGFGTND